MTSQLGGLWLNVCMHIRASLESKEKGLHHCDRSQLLELALHIVSCVCLPSASADKKLNQCKGRERRYTRLYVSYGHSIGHCAFCYLMLLLYPT